MSTETTPNKLHAIQIKTRVLRLCFVLVFTLLIALGLLAAARAKQPGFGVETPHTKSGEASPTDYSFFGVGRGNQAVPLSKASELVSSRVKLESLTPQSGANISIDFNNAAPGTVISNQYPFVSFSTDPAFFPVVSSNAYFETSGFLDRGPPSANSRFAPLYVDFTTPVSNPSFQIIGFDDYNTDLATVYLKTTDTPGPNHWAAIIRINRFFPDPNRAQISFSNQNVVRIEVRDIRDSGGLAFDNFSFTVPNALPPAPAGLTATVTDQKVS